MSVNFHIYWDLNQTQFKPQTKLLWSWIRLELKQARDSAVKTANIKLKYLPSLKVIILTIIKLVHRLEREGRTLKR